MEAPKVPAAAASNEDLCKSRACSAGVYRISGRLGCCRADRPECVRCGRDNHSRPVPVKARKGRRSDMPMAHRAREQSDVARGFPPNSPQAPCVESNSNTRTFLDLESNMMIHPFRFVARKKREKMEKCEQLSIKTGDLFFLSGRCEQLGIDALAEEAREQVFGLTTCQVLGQSHGQAFKHVGGFLFGHATLYSI